MAAAFETLRLASGPLVEMRQSRSQCLSRELAQAFAFGAKHKRERKGQRRGLERLGSFLGEPDPQETGFAKLT